jgi:hypothetical protein
MHAGIRNTGAIAAAAQRQPDEVTKMKRRLKNWLLLAVVIPGFAAAASPSLQLRDLAAATGLTERQVQMIVGAHTAFAEYRTSYDWALQRFVRALGQQRYDALMAGREIVLDDGQRVAMVDH